MNAHPVWVISTHLDDAVLSCCQFLDDCDAPGVVTVFTGAPSVVRSDGWNHATTGEAFAPDTQAVRRAEDAEALRLVGAEAHWLGLHEAEYRSDHQDLDEVAAAIDGFLRRHDATDVVAPLGLRHSDHLAVADACRRLMFTDDRSWRVYLDVPYARTHPELIHQRLASATAAGLTLVELAPIPVVGSTKLRAVGAYRTQVEAVRSEHPELDVSLTDPERSWRVVSPTGTVLDPAASTVA